MNVDTYKLPSDGCPSTANTTTPRDGGIAENTELSESDDKENGITYYVDNDNIDTRGNDVIDVDAGNIAIAGQTIVLEKNDTTNNRKRCANTLGDFFVESSTTTVNDEKEDADISQMLSDAVLVEEIDQLNDDAVGMSSTPVKKTTLNTWNMINGRLIECTTLDELQKVLKKMPFANKIFKPQVQALLHAQVQVPVKNSASVVRLEEDADEIVESTMGDINALLREIEIEDKEGESDKQKLKVALLNVELGKLRVKLEKRKTK